jgi:hypothetical protein
MLRLQAYCSPWCSKTTAQMPMPPPNCRSLEAVQEESPDRQCEPQSKERKGSRGGAWEGNGPSKGKGL